MIGYFRCWGSWLYSRYYKAPYQDGTHRFAIVFLTITLAILGWTILKETTRSTEVPSVPATRPR